jgi:hypothetical protein
MITRPPIHKITYISADGNPHQFIVGCGCTEIRDVEESGLYCYLPWVGVWDGEKLLFRASQHNLEHIIY